MPTLTLGTVFRREARVVIAITSCLWHANAKGRRDVDRRSLRAPNLSNAIGTLS
jgi:hypothetical protein